MVYSELQVRQYLWNTLELRNVIKLWVGTSVIISNRRKSLIDLPFGHKEKISVPVLLTPILTNIYLKWIKKWEESLKATGLALILQNPDLDQRREEAYIWDLVDFPWVYMTPFFSGHHPVFTCTEF